MGPRLDFVVAGAQKAGTTSLHDYLRQHPLLFLPQEKDFVVFMEGQPNNVSQQDLGRFFRPARPDQLLGLTYVDLLYFPECPARMRRHNPAMKVFVLLRDPVERAYSAYRFNLAWGRETSPTFQEALDREEERSKGSWRDRATRTYLSHGHYADQLEEILAHFPPAQLHVAFSEELARDARTVVAEALRFLGVADDVSLRLGERENVASSPRWASLQRFLWSPPGWLWRAYQGLPAGVKRVLRYGVVARLNRLNLAPAPNPPMDPGDRERLSAYYAPRNRRLAELLGRDLPDWG